jgi:hypothetical protein
LSLRLRDAWLGWALARSVWALSAGVPRPAGVLQIDSEGRVEPAAGVPAPTGPIVLASK